MTVCAAVMSSNLDELCEYEKKRLANIEQNNDVLKQLGLMNEDSKEESATTRANARLELPIDLPVVPRGNRSAWDIIHNRATANGPPSTEVRAGRADDVTSCSGELALTRAKKKGHWPDGEPVGRGHASPYLHGKYAAMIANGLKTHEGRPGGGWLDFKRRRIARNDYIRFKISGTGRRGILCVRVLGVKAYASFREMIMDTGVTCLLPDLNAGDIDGAESVYLALANQRGTYASLERHFGAVAVHVQTLSSV